jgi:hypothetical protein
MESVFAIGTQSADVEVDGGATALDVFLEKDVALYRPLCENGNGVGHIGWVGGLGLYGFWRW